MEKGRSAFKTLTGKPTGKRSLGRPRRRQEVNIRIIYIYKNLVSIRGIALIP